MTFTSQEVQLAAGTVTALSAQSVGPSNEFAYNLLFNAPVKQIQLEWDITTSTSCSVQIYESFPDFAQSVYVANTVSAAGSGEAFIDLEGTGLGSTVAVIVKCNNYDASNSMNVVSLNVLGVADN